MFRISIAPTMIQRPTQSLSLRWLRNTFQHIQVAGRLNPDGRPEFVSREIVGYYLKTIGPRGSIARRASSPHVDFAAARSGRESG
jgi:hypothetical protein